MKKRNADSGHGVSVGSDYWISYTDIMTGLLLVFIILIIALIISLQDIRNEFKEKLALLEKEKQAVQQVYDGHKKNVEALIQDIGRDLKKSGIDVEIDNYSIHISNEALGFVKGKYEIKEQAYLNIIDKMRAGIYSSMKNDSNLTASLDTVFIEGHTDKDRYYNDALKGNWGLSTLRAISFWERLVDDGRGLSMDDLVMECTHHKKSEEGYLSFRQRQACFFINLENAEQKNMFSVSGYAASRPHKCAREYVNTPQKLSEECQLLMKQIKNEPTMQGKADALNRRIDIRFVPKTPTSQEIQDMLNRQVSE